jgi:membrane protease YdiL (CAAX protease family)
MSIKKLILVAIVFIILVFGTFASIGFIFKFLSGGKNELGRLATEGITCLVAFIGYRYLRPRFVGRAATPTSTARWPLAGWAMLGLVFAATPYLVPQGVVVLKLENFQRPLILAAGVFAASAAIIEEILFRDILLQNMMRHYRVGICLFTQAILFGGVHFFSISFDWFAGAELAVAAMLFSFLWLLTGDFIAPMVAHFILNFTFLIFHGVASPLVFHPGLLPLVSTPVPALLRLAFESVALGVVWWAWCKAGKPNRA